MLKNGQRLCKLSSSQRLEIRANFYYGYNLLRRDGSAHLVLEDSVPYARARVMRLGVQGPGHLQSGYQVPHTLKPIGSHSVNQAMRASTR